MSDRPEDRREHRRVTASMPVMVGGGAKGETQDVSLGGMGLRIAEKMERGQTVEIVLDVPARPGEEIKTMATVMWSAETDTGAYLAGLKFDGPSPDALERLKKFIADHGE